MSTVIPFPAAAPTQSPRGCVYCAVRHLGTTAESNLAEALVIAERTDDESAALAATGARLAAWHRAAALLADTPTFGPDADDPEDNPLAFAEWAVTFALLESVGLPMSKANHDLALSTVLLVLPPLDGSDIDMVVEMLAHLGRGWPDAA